MFLNQMRGLRQKEKEGKKKNFKVALPPCPKQSIHSLSHLFAVLKFATVVSLFS